MRPRKTYGRDQTEDRPTIPTPSPPYRQCAFHDCDLIPAEELGFPLCPEHCRTVYFGIKDLLPCATTGRATTGRPNGKAKPLASKRMGIIYFARVDGLIKIGYTTNLKLRIRVLQAELLATLPGTMDTEKALHAKFGPCWVRGELFRPEPELMGYIKSVAVTQDTQ